MPAVAKKLPDTLILPLMVNVLLVVTVPDTVRLSNKIPVPLIVLPAPVRVSVPPVLWVNTPGPVVERFPAILIAADEEVILEALICRLLKVCAADPDMVVPGPFIMMVPVPGVKVPLFTQLPVMVCVKLPPLKVVETPMVSLPLMVILAPAIKVTLVPEPMPRVKFPAMVKAVALVDLVTAPAELLKLRLP